MGRSRLGWACNAIAPWCLALGLVVSITAEAGQDPAVIKGAAFENAQTSARRALSSGAFLLSDGALDAAAGKPRLIEASLTLGNPDDLGGIDDEIDPRADLKRTRLPMPVVDRSRKGNPFIGLRPGFDAKLHRPKASAAAGDGRPSFIDPFGSVESALAYAELPPDTEATPWSDPDAAPTKSLTFDDGATPSVPLDVALNSATPAPSDDTPIAVAAKPEIPGVSDIAKTMANGQPDYASLIDPKDSTRQQRCLAEAVYFEARSEPEDGQAAVAQVVLNRVRSGLYPANVCGVVYQDRNRPFACQFSFACEGKSLRVEEPGPWSVAVRIAQDVTEGKVYNAKVGAALNYHANYVMPYWASTLKRVDQIGHHIFYQLRISQN